jgi:hypothetical protein
VRGDGEPAAADDDDDDDRAAADAIEDGHAPSAEAAGIPGLTELARMIGRVSRQIDAAADSGEEGEGEGGVALEAIPSDLDDDDDGSGVDDDGEDEEGDDDEEDDEVSFCTAGPPQLCVCVCVHAIPCNPMHSPNLIPTHCLTRCARRVV